MEMEKWKIPHRVTQNYKIQMITNKIEYIKHED